MVNTDRQPISRAFVAFALGGVAQGIPFALIAVHVDQGDAGTRWVAAVALARLMPYLLCSPSAGALVARVSPHRVFVVCGVARAATAMAIWVALSWSAPNIVLLLLLFGLVALGTPTYPALMRVVHDVAITERHRTAAIAAGLESATFWVGPAIGGLLLATGARGAMPLCAALSVLSAVLIGTGSVADHASTRARSSTLIVRAAGGLVERPARPAVVSVLVVNVLTGLLSVLLVDLAGQLGGPREQAYGTLALVQGIGAAVVLLALVGPLRIHHVPRAPLAAALLAVALLSAADRMPLAIAACVLFGAAALASEVVVSSVVSLSLPTPLVAPAIGLLDTGMVAAMLLGTVIAPSITAAIGAQAALASASAMASAALLVGSRSRQTAHGSARRGSQNSRASRVTVERTHTADQRGSSWDFSRRSQRSKAPTSPHCASNSSS